MASDSLSLRLDAGTRARLDRLAQQRGTKVSELLREAVAVALGDRPATAPGTDATAVPEYLTVVQRHTLALLHQVLGHLAPEDADEHRHRAEALQQGFVGAYGEEFTGIREELPLAECVLVEEILGMFEQLHHAVTRLGEDAADLDEETRDVLEFGGFDYQVPREGRMAGYVRHLLAGGLWGKPLADQVARHDRGNSHSPRLGRYQAMLDTYKIVTERRRVTHRQSSRLYEFTVEELREIAVAAG
ncbi:MULTISPECIES: YfbU family protein [Actinosynnema]|uniref:YfbU family protein n=1 Tax=Actinosynnema TaxID=40566 RepID=UPI0020A28A41|nr:YfbU family protein [Actinosynnema pretiosum]MCP2097363.1 hypothetical protein [Actinosynnema pretiosum]